MLLPWRTLLACLALSGLAGARVQGSTLQRPHDPVLLAGAALAPLSGNAAPGDVVAFRFAPGAGWTQVPVQIDERAVVAFDDVYGPGYSLGSRLTVLSYTDPLTWTGADPDGLFDADDELVLMASDAGGRAPPGTAEPAGVVPASGLELAVSDPLPPPAGGGTGYLYLFASRGGLDPSAGEDRVAYDFNLLSGNYLATYNTALGPNPESSTVMTASYGTRFVDRWIRTGLRVFAGGASGVDVLDRQKYLFAPGQCSRTEETFSNGEGAFFANVDGPLRGIRSMMGANSGPISQRDQFFYETSEHAISYVRVHPLTMGGMDVFDYSPAASGMIYANDKNPLGVTIDGIPDLVTPGRPLWELATGAQGTLYLAHWIETDIQGLVVTNYYGDDTTPQAFQCTGDPYEYGTSGPWATSPTPNTDPLLGRANQLWIHRRHDFEAPGGDAATAALRAQQAETPLTVLVTAFAGCTAGVASHCTPGTSASGCQALLSAAGAPSASAPSGFTVTASGVEGAKDGLFYYGTSGAQASPWGNGSSYQCVVPPLRRTGLLGSTGTPGACDGVLAQDLNAYWSAEPSKRPQAGQTVDLELWYRDPQNTSNQTTSLSDALEFCTGP